MNVTPPLPFGAASRPAETEAVAARAAMTVILGQGRVSGQSVLTDLDALIDLLSNKRNEIAHFLRQPARPVSPPGGHFIFDDSASTAWPREVQRG